MHTQHAQTSKGKGNKAESPSQFSTMDTLSLSLEATQRRPLRRDMAFMAVLLMALTVALVRIA